MSKKRNQNKANDPSNMALCTCAAIRKTARIVTQMYETALEPTGLKPGQLTLLAVLSNKGAMPMTNLADAMVLDRTTLTRNLKPMVRDGLVNIRTEKDQRVRVVELTSKGTKKFKEAYPLWVDVQSRLVDGIGSERWSGFVTDLNVALDVARSS